MKQLFEAELLRLRGWALALGLVHLAVLAFMLRMVDLAQQALLVYWSFGAVYALAGLLLGLYQVGPHARPNAWLNLLHRPLAPARIAVALLLAGVVLLAVVVAVPILLAAAWQETMTARVVDLRHWLLVPATLQVSVAGYLAGAHAMLAGRRTGASGIVLLGLLLAAGATGFGMLALQSLVLAWLAWMVFASFKPMLGTPPEGIAATLALVLPLQMLVYLGLLLACAGAEMLWVAQGSHPNNTATPPRGGHNEVEKMDPRARMLAALLGSTHADAALLREQVALSEPQGLELQLARLPQRFELANVVPMEFDDTRRGTRWVFSHDDMRLHGYGLGDGRDVGTLGVGEEGGPFPMPALPAGNLPGMGDGDVLLLAGDTAWQYDSADTRVRARLRLPGNEPILGVAAVGERIGVLGDRAIHFFDGRDAALRPGLIEPRLRVPLPAPLAELHELDLIELVDGYLVMSTISAHAHEGGMAPFLEALRVHEDGRAETVARRPLAHDYPAAYRYRGFVLSPLLHALQLRAERLFAPPQPLDAVVREPVPVSMRWLAGLLAFVSLLGAAWCARRAALPAKARLAWAAAGAAVGVPALLAFLLLHPPREWPEAGVAAAPVAA